MKAHWKGVFPALTTQFKPDQSLDIEATTRHLDLLIRSGIHGVILLGSVGENTSLEYAEKLTFLRETLPVAAGRIPALVSVAEYSTALAAASLATPKKRRGRPDGPPRRWFTKRTRGKPWHTFAPWLAPHRCRS
jgi:dihydrodipicolinate synthase/N-acetylneuraminate lyase